MSELKFPMNGILRIAHTHRNYRWKVIDGSFMEDELSMRNREYIHLEPGMIVLIVGEVQRSFFNGSDNFIIITPGGMSHIDKRRVDIIS